MNIPQHVFEKRSPYYMDNEMIENVTEPYIPRDPVGLSDRIIFGTGLALYSVAGLMTLYAWWNRNYPPLRAKNLPLATMMWVGAFGWFIGSAVSNGLVDIEGVWRHCIFPAVWIRIGFGYMFTCSSLFRIYLLDRIFVQRRSTQGVRFHLPIFVFLAAVIIFCIISTVLPDYMTVIYLDKFKSCHYVAPYRFICLGIVASLWSLVAFLVWRIRNIHTAFNERIETIVIAVMALSTDIEMIVVHIVYLHYAQNRAVRSMAVMFDLTMGCTASFILLVYPVYQCIFHRDEYLQKWLLKLSIDGLHKEYLNETHRVPNTVDYAEVREHSTTYLSSKITEKNGAPAGHGAPIEMGDVSYRDYSGPSFDQFSVSDERQGSRIIL
ncbi:hypothetical protein FBU59_001188 [Linderina macrospora]|uniref:Uncharacterized protein n=1 Tax=Linderina macrospora TaxID=4868 RepID=A0ACC1JEJ0_9FUNG|nr:hypothetical protein FBU59_001188 [Linderina macrospora]